ARLRALALASLVAACSAPRVLPPPPPVRPPPPPEASRWLPIDAAPDEAGAVIVARLKDAELRVDRGDVRWLFLRGEPPRHADAADPARPHVMGFVLGGLLAVDEARRVRFAREPLGAWEELGALPEGLRLDSIAV